MRQTNVRGSLSLRGFRKLRTGAIVATGVILLGLGFLAPTVSASEQDGVWVARTVEEVKADIQKEGDLFKYVIKWGDTLSVISEASNIPVDVLQEMNQASGKNLFLPHNELYFTEAETVSDTVTKHKIVIKESGASGEVRTYEVLLKKDQETKAVTFELTDVTEKVEKMTVNYSSVYQPVSAPVVERAEESVEEPASEASAETSPEVKEETEAPVASKAEDAATTPAPKETAPEVVTPAEPNAEAPAPKVETSTESSEPKGTEAEPEVAKPAEPNAETPTPKVEEPVTPAPKEEKPATPAPKAEEPATPAPKEEKPATPEPKEEKPATPAPKEEKPATPAPKEEKPATPAPKAEEPATPAPKVEEPEASAEPKGTAPVVEEGTSGEQDQPAEETPAPSKPETPASTEEVAKEAEGTEPEAAKPAESKAETPAESTESKATEPEVAKPAESNAEAATESTEASGTSAETTPKEDATEEKAEMPKVEEPAPAVEGTTAGEQGQPVEETPAPKESGEEGKAEDSVSSTESSSTASEGESTVTQPSVESGTDSTSEAEGKTSEEAGTQAPAESATVPKETDSTSEKEVEESGATGKEAKETEPNAETLAPKVEEPTESSEPKGTVESESAPKENVTEGTSDVTPGGTGEASGIAGESTEPKNSVESTPEGKESAEGVPGTVDSAPAPNEAGTTSGEEGKEPEKTSETANTPSTDVTTDGSSDDSIANEEKPQGDEPAVGNQSLEEDTKDSNKAAIDDDRKTKDEEINKSTLSEEQKKEAREKVTKLTEEYHNKLKSEQDTDKQAELVDEYRDKLNKIETPGIEHTGPDFKKPIESHAGGTTIDENSTVANSALTSSNPSSQPSSSGDSSQTQPAATSDSSTTGNSGFRRAGEYQARARRTTRSVNQPDGTVNISYMYDEMPDIHGFLSDPGEDNTVTIPAGTSEAQAKELVKEKIQAKIKDLAARGYHVKNDIIFEQDTTVKNFNYVVTFTKETTGTTGFRIAPKVQVRAKKVAKRDLSNKTKKINVYYNLTSLKDIAGALGELGGENVLTFSGETSKEELKRAVAEKTKAQIEKLKKQGFTVTSTTDLDQIVEGGDSYDYVVEFTKESKTQPVGTTGFRKAPLVQRRAKRSTEVKETVNVNIYFNLKTLPGIAGALDVDGDTTIKLPKNASEEEVKEAIKAKIAKVESRGYRVNDFYFGAKTEKGYDYVVEFTK